MSELQKNDGNPCCLGCSGRGLSWGPAVSGINTNTVCSDPFHSVDLSWEQKDREWCSSSRHYWHLFGSNIKSLSYRPQPNHRHPDEPSALLIHKASVTPVNPFTFKPWNPLSKTQIIHTQLDQCIRQGRGTVMDNLRTQSVLAMRWVQTLWCISDGFKSWNYSNILALSLVGHEVRESPALQGIWIAARYFYSHGQGQDTSLLDLSALDGRSCRCEEAGLPALPFAKHATRTKQ